MKRLEEMELEELKDLIGSRKFRLKTKSELLKKGWEPCGDCLTNDAFQFSISLEVFNPGFRLDPDDIEYVDHKDDSFRVSCFESYEWLPLSIIVPTSTIDKEDEELLL